MRSRVFLSLSLATLSLAAVACTALLGDFEESESDNALTDATVDATIADTSMDTSSALDSNAGDSSLDTGLNTQDGDAAGGDAADDTGVADSGFACLPAVCADAGPKTYASCFSFDNLGGGMPLPFVGGPPAGYGPGKCGDALSLLQTQMVVDGDAPQEMDLELPTSGGATFIDFDIRVTRAAPTIFTARELAQVFGPSGRTSQLYSLSLWSTADAFVGIGFRNITGVVEPTPAKFEAGKWMHASIALTIATIDLSLANGESSHIVLPTNNGVARGPAWNFNVVNAVTEVMPYTGIYIDNLVIVTTPVDAGP